MTPMLAQSLTDIAPDWLRNMMLFVAALAATVYYIKEIFFGPKAPEQMNMKVVETLATKQELEKVETASKKEDAILHGRITDQAKEFNKSINELPMQIVTLLRNTGAIK
jgi:hypothetical protein